MKSNRDHDDPVSAIQDLVEQALQDVDDASSRRRELTTKFLREIEKEIAEAKRMLDSLGDLWKHGEQSLPYEQFRHALDRAVTARTKDRRAELLRDWSDRLKLLDRRLEVIRELTALQATPKQSRS